MHLDPLDHEADVVRLPVQVKVCDVDHDHDGVGDVDADHGCEDDGDDDEHVVGDGFEIPIAR